jgi:hypothetical protein
MPIHDKFRSFEHGLPLGIPACEVAGEKVLLMRCVPLELSASFERWLQLHDDLVRDDSPRYALRHDKQRRRGVLWTVWGQFVNWMGEQIDADGSDYPDHASAFALTNGMSATVPERDLHGESVLYLDEAPLEFRHALRCWLSAGLQSDLARKDENGRVAISWDGWAAFRRWLNDTMGESLRGLERALEGGSKNTP